MKQTIFIAVSMIVLTVLVLENPVLLAGVLYSVGAVLAFTGALILFVVIRLYIASLQGRRWEATGSH